MYTSKYKDKHKDLRARVTKKTYGRATTFESEGDLYESITGHRSTSIDQERGRQTLHNWLSSERRYHSETAASLCHTGISLR